MPITVKLTISLPKDLAEFATKLARETNRPRSRVFADLLNEKREEALRESLIEGYQALANDSRGFAREAMPLAAEVWDEADYGTRTRETESRE